MTPEAASEYRLSKEYRAFVEVALYGEKTANPAVIEAARVTQYQWPINYSELSDAHLFRLWCAYRDDRAVAELFKYNDHLVDLLMKERQFRLCRDEAEDIVQVAWIIAHRCLEFNRYPARIRYWILGLARSQAAHRHRIRLLKNAKLRRRRLRSTIPQPTPEPRTRSEEMLAIVTRAMQAPDCPLSWFDRRVILAGLWHADLHDRAAEIDRSVQVYSKHLREARPIFEQWFQANLDRFQ